jgi:hypothetical protein
LFLSLAESGRLRCGCKGGSAAKASPAEPDREAGKEVPIPPSPGTAGGSSLDDPQKRREIQRILLELHEDVTPEEIAPVSGGHPLGCAIFFVFSVIILITNASGASIETK